MDKKRKIDLLTGISAGVEAFMRQAVETLREDREALAKAARMSRDLEKMFRQFGTECLIGSNIKGTKER